jgi:hypothetical protein
MKTTDTRPSKATAAPKKPGKPASKKTESQLKDEDLQKVTGGFQYDVNRQ